MPLLVFYHLIKRLNLVLIYNFRGAYFIMREIPLLYLLHLFNIYYER